MDIVPNCSPETLRDELRTVLSMAMTEYKLHDDHLDLHDEPRAYLSATLECEAGLKLLDDAVEGASFKTDELASEYANLIRSYRSFLAESGSRLRLRMLDELIGQIERAETAEQGGDYGTA